MKSRRRLTADQSKVINREALKASYNAIESRLIDFDSNIAWNLHKRGWGKKRITDFFRDVLIEREKMKAWYNSDDSDNGMAEYAMRYKLKEAGIDLFEIYEVLEQERAKLSEGK